MILFHDEIQTESCKVIEDIHTHVLPEVAGTALVCIGCGPLPDSEGHCFSAGLHPWDVTGHDEESFRNLEELLANPAVLAVGECGLDTLRGPSHALQEQAFIRQAELSGRYGKPMILHVVRDFDTIIRLHRELRPGQPWLIHGFRGGPEQMMQLLRLGIQVSFGPRHNPQSLMRVTEEHLFLETDGQASIAAVIQSAASIRNERAEVIQEQIKNNSERFLFLSKELYICGLL